MIKKANIDIIYIIVFYLIL